VTVDVPTLQEPLARQARGWKARWEKARAAGVTSLYTFLSAMALWPVVEAAQRGDLSLIFALGGVLAGVGGDLLANQIQSWKDGVQDEQGLAQRLAPLAAENAGVRAALDAVLERLDVLAQAQAGLSEADQAWFAEALQAELARVGNLPHHEAVLIGDGTIAQGEDVIAAGRGGVAAREIHGPVVVGDHNVIHELPPQVLELFARQFGFDPTASDAEALRTYFNNIILERHSKLSFLFIRPETGKVYTEADIESVFVPLRMTDPDTIERQARLSRRMERFDRLPREMEESARPVTLPGILHKYPCFLLRGKPGCGKTTLLRHIALTFARGEHTEKLDWQGPAPLPLLIPLRNLGEFLKRRAARYIEPQPRALLEYLEEHLQGAGVRFSPDFLPRRLDSGQCFLLLDALDEASGVLDGGGDLRAAVARQVAAFIRHYQPKGNRFALTSRPRAYQEDSPICQALPQPRVCDVLDLDPAGYGQLIVNLLTVLTGDAAAGQAEATDLCARIAPNRHLSDLAGNPLLCTTLVLVYKYRGRKLPERRVDVLHEIVTLLLGRWEEERRDVASPDELARLGTTAATTEQAIQFRRRALMALAWQMQQDAAAEISLDGAVRALARFYCDEERADDVTAERWARAFLAVAHERSGLFIAADEGLHTFAHQAFREYLAATHLVNAGERRLLDETMRHAPTPDEWWEQVLLLAGAHPELSSGAAGRLVETLLARDDVEYAHLAARCAQDMTDKLPGAQRKLLQDWLLARMRDGGRPAKERARAGDALALAGDPRFRGDAWFLPDEPLLGFVEIPAGPFTMGTRKRDIETLLKRSGGERDWYEDETPQHEVNLPAYYMARYPVTVAQFRAFVKDSGHTPGDPDSLRGLDNHPVVRVSWHEAIAYCRWLRERLQAWEGTPEPLASLLGEQGWKIALPSEAEWEKAARGGEQIPNPKSALCTPHSEIRNPNPWRVFPWGDDADPERANYGDTGIGTTSAVGCFPGGASPYGVEDVSGNVWEWTQSIPRGYPYNSQDGREDLEAGNDVGRVLRGGAFSDEARYVRCAFRYGNFPHLRDWNFGFRVVVVSPVRL